MLIEIDNGQERYFADASEVIESMEPGARNKGRFGYLFREDVDAIDHDGDAEWTLTFRPDWDGEWELCAPGEITASTAELRAAIKDENAA